MNAEKMIKVEAKKALSEKWVQALLSLFLVIFIPIITALIAASAYAVLGETEVSDLFSKEPVKAALFVVLNAASVAVLILLSPLYTGFARVFSKAAHGEEIDAADLFWFFDSRQRYKNAVAFMAGLLVKCLGITVACEVAALVVAFVGVDSDAIMGAAIVLAVIGLIAAFLLFHRFAFSVALFSYYDYDGVTAAQTGARIAKTGTGKLIKLTLSFIPWLLLTYFVVPLLYVYPYMTCAYFVSAKYLISDYLEREKAKPEPLTASSAAAPETHLPPVQANAVTLEKEEASAPVDEAQLSTAPAENVENPGENKLTPEKKPERTDDPTEGRITDGI